jgi:hypothetical protein
VLPNAPAPEMDERVVKSGGSNIRLEVDVPELGYCQVQGVVVDTHTLPEGSCVVAMEEDVVAVFISLVAKVTDRIGNHTLFDQLITKASIY